MGQWHNIYITDKTGKKYFNTTASPLSAMSEIRNLENHLKQAEKYPDKYKFLDIETAVIMLDGEPYYKITDSDIDLLDELFS